jgi:uncharacterized protein
MLEISEFALPLDAPVETLPDRIAVSFGIPRSAILEWRLIKRAIDARKKSEVIFRLTVDVEFTPEVAARLGELPPSSLGKIRPTPDRAWNSNPLDFAPKLASARQSPIIVGTGPCGLFCGLLLARAGKRPILFERGKQAGPRARDVTAFWRRGGEFSAESNVQYGEGGAGTFSDGKLYTQIRDRENRIPWILREMVAAGAPEDILLKARPHIGTDRLIKVVRHIREEIITLGGEVHFETRIADVLLDKNRQVRGVVTQDGREFSSDIVILAVGHSSRDTFATLHRHRVQLEPKPLSVGVRVEHPQALIDRTQYGKFAGHPNLGAAPYKFVWHDPKRSRSAYSFCMCPGGLVVAAGSEPETVVTNGMSSYARAEANANAGFMVDVSPKDYGLTEENPLAGVDFQRALERKAYVIGGRNYHAPVQTIGDFLARRPTQSLGSVKPSYEPGVTPADLREILPSFVADVLRAAIPQLDRQLAGFANPEGLLTAVETRSSSPVRILRDDKTLQSVNTPGLYPAGEGAGYAGGIISAAVDGMRVAEVLLASKA